MDRLAKIAQRTRALSAWIEVSRNIWGLLALLGVAVFLVGRLAIAHYGVTRTLLAVALLTIVFCGGFASGVLTGSKRSVVAEYSWESADYTYQFDRDDFLHHVQISKITIRANRQGVLLFRNRYWWTGVGRAQLSVLSPQHKLLTELVREAWRYYYILLEQALSKGGSTTVVVRHDLHDTERMFQPLISKDISEPVASFTLRIIFPAALRPSRVVAAELARSKARDAYWQTVKQQEIAIHEATGEVVYSIHRPTLGRRYQISWTWTGYPSAQAGLPPPAAS